MRPLVQQEHEEAYHAGVLGAGSEHLSHVAKINAAEALGLAYQRMNPEKARG